MDTKPPRLLVWFLTGLVLGALAFFATGLGDGTYIPLALLFPYTVLSFVLPEQVRQAFFLLIPIQLPVYCILLAAARAEHPRRAVRVGVAMAIVHCLAAAASLLILYGDKY